MTNAVLYDSASFDAGQECGIRVAARLARLSALELIDGSRWWNRQARRRMASALVAYADDLESAADGRCASFRPPSARPTAVPCASTAQVGADRRFGVTLVPGTRKRNVKA